MRTRYRGLAAPALLAGIAACGDSPVGPIEPGPPPPLQPAVWHAHTSGGRPLPALVADGAAGGRREQIFLDSARLEILAGGRWERRVHFQRWLDGEFAGLSARLDQGTWAAADSGWVFTSERAGRPFLLRSATPDSLSFLLAEDAVPGLMQVTLRRVRPAPGPWGAWRAEAVGGRAIPAAVLVFDPTAVDGREVSTHFIADSAFIRLGPTGRYDHVVFYSEWEGEVGGPPVAKRIAWRHADHGTWSRTGDALRFDSGWLQNHFMTGTFGAGGTLRVQHGLAHGDEPADFRYVRID
jgi:hypothetical protein